MILIEETQIRVLEAFNALSSVLPLYDNEARKVYSGVFGQDIADVLPLFFGDIARASIQDPQLFTQYINFLYECINYIRGDRKTMPLAKDAPEYFAAARDKAKKQMNAWNVKVKDKID